MLVSIFSANQTTAARIRRLLLQEGLECPAEHVIQLDLASAHLARAKPELVVTQLGPDLERSVVALAAIRLLTPARIIAVGPASDPKLVIRALRSGADDYVDEDDLETSLREALPRCRTALQTERDLGRVVAVLAPSGGSGSSTVAVNLAAVLARDHKEVVLIDMKLVAGDLAALLDLKPRHHLSDLCRNRGQMDQSLFRSPLERHSSGVHLLAAPGTIADVEYVTVEAVRQILTLARAGFPYVIVDLDHTFGDEQAQVLREADEILLVLRMDFTALRNTRRTLEFLEASGIEKSRVRLVVNRYGQPKEVPAAAAEEALGIKIYHQIPDDPRTVNQANNNGVPVVIEAATSKVARSIVKLAANIDAHKTHAS